MSPSKTASKRKAPMSSQSRQTFCSLAKVKLAVRARPRHNSSLLANNFVNTDSLITKVARNGKLQIKMHGFAS
jgi:hypothetical protein